jgi:hypothetical protein
VGATALIQTVDNHPRLVALSLASVIVFFAVACTFNAAIPVCHWLFHCDHWFHSGDTVSALGSTPPFLCHL